MEKSSLNKQPRCFAILLKSQPRMDASPENSQHTSRASSSNTSGELFLYVKRVLKDLIKKHLLFTVIKNRFIRAQYLVLPFFLL